MIIWSPGMSLEEVEEKVIQKAYDFFIKNAETAANSLKISLDDFNEKMDKFKLKEQEIKKLIDKEKEKEREYLERSRGIPPENSLNYKNETPEIQMPIPKKQPDHKYQSNLKHKS